MIWLFCKNCGETTPHDMFPRGNICRECGRKAHSIVADITCPSYHRKPTMEAINVIHCDNGKHYHLSSATIQRLKTASYANEAEEIFQQEAPHVPKCDRCKVWMAVDEFVG